MSLQLTLSLTVAIALAGCAISQGETCSKSNVDITWLGGTTHFVRYWHNGKEVKLLLDDQIAKNHASRTFDQVLGVNGKLDYIFIGHNHFDHEGTSPFQEQAVKYSAKVVAPKYGCDVVKSGTECTTVLPSPESPQVIDLAHIGLRVTAVPQAHSYIANAEGHGSRGAPGAQGGIDTFSYLLEFAGESMDVQTETWRKYTKKEHAWKWKADEGSAKECSSSFFWAVTAHDRAPFLNGYLEKGNPDLPMLNYQRLLKQAFAKMQGNARTSLMAFPAHFMPNEEAWQEWAQIVRPLYHTNHNHHHGETDLSAKLVGSALGSESATWIASAKVPWTRNTRPAYTPTFMPLEDFFSTLRLRGSSSVEKVDLGYAAKFRSTDLAMAPSSIIV